MKFIEIYCQEDKTVYIFNVEQLEFLNFHDIAGDQEYAEIKFKNFDHCFSLDTDHEDIKKMMKINHYDSPSQWFLDFLRNEEIFLSLILTQR